MLKIDQIDDISTAKQVATILHKENERLHKRVEEQAREIARLKGEDGGTQLVLEIERLKEQMSAMQRRLYGASSEKRRGGKGSKEKQRERQTGHGPRPQPELPIVEEVYESEKEEQICELCHGVLEEWAGQFEESEEITVVERHFELKKIKRQKYRCKCGGSIKTAPGTLKLQPGGRYSVEFAVEVAIQKYLDHLPLERQVRIMKREGLQVDSQTLWDQIWALSRVVAPIYEQLPEHIYSYELIHADETRWYLLEKGGRKTWQIWCIATPSPEAVHYSLLPERSARAGSQSLGDFEGTVVCDGYAVYAKLARDGPYRIDLAFCMAHARRKFVDCEKEYPAECKPALDLIGELYEVERKVPDPWTLQGEEREAAFALRAKLRNEESRPIADKLKAWALRQSGLSSKFTMAVKYLINHWQGLTRYLDDAKIPIDNNQAERTLRGPVVGRKNHYGSKSKRGTEVAAIFYSLIETAKLQGVDPKSYLLAAAKAALENPGSITWPRDILQ